MKYKVFVCRESVYVKEIEALSEDEAEQLADKLFELDEETFKEVDTQFEVIDIKEVQND